MLCQYYYDQDSDSLLYYSRFFYEASDKAGYVAGTIYFKTYEGRYYENAGKYNEAVKCWLDAMELAVKSGRRKLIGWTSVDIGRGYFGLHKYDKASEYYLKALAIYREFNDPNSEIRILSHLANVYKETGFVQKAKDASLRVITLVDSLKLEPVRKATALFNVATSYKLEGKPMEAIRAYHKAAQLFQQNNDLKNYYKTLPKFIEFLVFYDNLNLYGKEIGDSRNSLDIALDYAEQCESWYRSQ